MTHVYVIPVDGEDAFVPPNGDLALNRVLLVRLRKVGQTRTKALCRYRLALTLEYRRCGHPSARVTRVRGIDNGVVAHRSDLHLDDRRCAVRAPPPIAS